MNFGRQAERYHLSFELLYPHHHTQLKFMSRVPRPLEKTDSLLRPFSPLIWSLFTLTTLSFSLMFLVAHSTYSSDGVKQWKLHRHEVSKVNFLLYTFSKVAEPDPVPWFTQKWSAGKFLAFLWSLYALLAVLFYACNLRAHLAALDHEEKIDTLQDVINNRQRPWIFTELAELG